MHLGYPLALALGDGLGAGGEEVVCVDTNPEHFHAAQERGFKVVFGNGLEERTLLRAEVDTRAGCLGSTTNEEINLLCVRRVRDDFRGPRVWLARARHEASPEDAMVSRADAESSGAAARPERKGVPAGEIASAAEAKNENLHPLEALPAAVSPLVLLRGRHASPVDETTAPRKGDRLVTAVLAREQENITATRAALGWLPVEENAEAGGEE